MEKSNVKGRTIKFLSKKNNCIISVHSRISKRFAEHLETLDHVVGYETLKLWDQSLYDNINPIYIRKDYLSTLWVTDFVIRYVDDSIGVREIVDSQNLYKLSTIERLELSRRYWKIMGITNWKIAIPEEG